MLGKLNKTVICRCLCVCVCVASALRHFNIMLQGIVSCNRRNYVNWTTMQLHSFFIPLSKSFSEQPRHKKECTWKLCVLRCGLHLSNLVYSENQTKLINTLYRRHVEVLNVKADGSYSYTVL